MMPSIKFRLNMARAMRQLREFEDTKALVGLAEKHTRRIVEILKGRTPVSRDFDDPMRGKLRAGWEGTAVAGTPNQRSIRITIGNRDPRRMLPRWLMRGTKAHWIRPVRAKILRFKLRDGSISFATKVRHPGTKPYPGLGNQLDREVSREVNFMMRSLRASIARRMQEAK